MKVIATNIGSRKKITYRGREVVTGIYKYPTDKGIFLGEEDVENDHVVDRRFHGGIDKACYLYSVEAYAFWKPLYPNLDWDYGMFGENLSVLGLNEKLLKIGDQYKIGGAVVEIAQPRQPCFKLGIRMGTQAILKQFINTYYSGVYVRVIKCGTVKKGDVFELVKEAVGNPSIYDVFYSLYQEKIYKSTIDMILNCDAVPESAKKDIKRRL